MFWLSTLTNSTALDAIASDARPWAVLKKFWQFSNRYGEYQSRPPSQRRQFILDMEQSETQNHSGFEHCS